MGLTQLPNEMYITEPAIWLSSQSKQLVSSSHKPVFVDVNGLIKGPTGNTSGESRGVWLSFSRDSSGKVFTRSDFRVWDLSRVLVQNLNLECLEADVPMSHGRSPVLSVGWPDSRHIGASCCGIPVKVIK